jgi:hypothetical protein
LGLYSNTLPQPEQGVVGSHYAYASLTKPASGYRVGPSDGNLGGEIVSNFQITPDATLDFVLEIFNGSIAFSFNGGAALLDTHGSVKTLNNAFGYAWDEFADGAYFGVDLYSPTHAVVAYDLAVGPPVTVPDVASTFGLLGLAVAIVLAARRRF